MPTVFSFFLRIRLLSFPSSVLPQKRRWIGFSGFFFSGCLTVSFFSLDRMRGVLSSPFSDLLQLPSLRTRRRKSSAARPLLFPFDLSTSFFFPEGQDRNRIRASLSTFLSFSFPVSCDRGVQQDFFLLMSSLSLKEDKMVPFFSLGPLLGLLSPSLSFSHRA